MKIYISKTNDILNHEGFHLQQDNFGTNFSAPWNDFGYTVKFKLLHVNKGSSNSIGELRFLINKIENTFEYLSNSAKEVHNNIFDITETLEKLDAVSVGLNIQYYRKINISLNSELSSIDTLLGKLHDASYLIHQEEKYSLYEGFNETILREEAPVRNIIRKGYSIAKGDYNGKKEFEFNVESNLETIENVEIKFNTSRKIGKTNINLLIGKNGSGKTHILSSLVNKFTGLYEQQEQLPFFHKLIVIAYSPFEQFMSQDKLLDEIEKNNKRKSSKKNTNEYKKQRRISINKYSYIGFKNEKNNFDITWPKKFSTLSIIKVMEKDWDDLWYRDKTRLDSLKETLSLCIDFDSLALKIKQESKESFFILSDNYVAFKLIKEYICIEEGLFLLKDEKPVSLSSGQEIYSYMIPAIIAEVEEESLLIMDEPELYLHPSMETGLMNMLKYILEINKSYAVIATHSAIIAREVHHEGIHIMRRNKEGRTTVDTPSTQTFGQSLEVIISESFDDNISNKPYEIELKETIDNIGCNSVLEEYSRDMGNSALAYTLATLSKDENHEIELRGL
ncbi:ATP-binding protein [Vibrio vulnificus]|nr:ATP-binding protein [Vibrio vulnificus]